MFAGVSLLPAGAEAELAAGSPVLPQTRSQPAEYRQPWGGAVRSAGPPRGLWVGVHLWPSCMWCNMMITVMVTTMWPTGSQRTMSSTGFGSDWTAETPWTTAAGNGAMGSLWVKSRYNQTKELLSKKKDTICLPFSCVFLVYIPELRPILLQHPTMCCCRLGHYDLAGHALWLWVRLDLQDPQRYNSTGPSVFSFMLHICYSPLGKSFSTVSSHCGSITLWLECLKISSLFLFIAFWASDILYVMNKLFPCVCVCVCVCFF